MKQIISIVLLALFTSSCCTRTQQCGKIVDKWREGKYNTLPIVVIEVNGTMHKGNVDDMTYAKAKAGETMCIMLCE